MIEGVEKKTMIWHFPTLLGVVQLPHWLSLFRQLYCSSFAAWLTLLMVLLIIVLLAATLTNKMAKPKVVRLVLICIDAVLPFAHAYFVWAGFLELSRARHGIWLGDTRGSQYIRQMDSEFQYATILIASTLLVYLIIRIARWQLVAQNRN